MNGVEVKKTHPGEFEKIYPLLKEFNSPYAREDWRRIFAYRWDGVEEYMGFHLEHNGHVVGFMGLIFSCRRRHNREYKFCNITSLIVKDGYRAATIMLVRKLKHLEDTICTGLSPISESYRLLKMVGFTAYESHFKIISTLNGFLRRGREVDVSVFPALLDRIDAENRRLVIDHVGLKCESILFDFNGNPCLLIYRVTRQKYCKVPLRKVRILYISDVERFNENLTTILRIFHGLFGFLSAMYVDSRFIHDQQLLFSIEREVVPPRICSGLSGGQMEIDELYSEAVLL